MRRNLRVYPRIVEHNIQDKLWMSDNELYGHVFVIVLAVNDPL